MTIKLASPLSEQATDHVGHALNTAMKETENKEGQHAQFSPKELLDLVNKYTFHHTSMHSSFRLFINPGERRFKTGKTDSLTTLFQDSSEVIRNHTDSFICCY